MKVKWLGHACFYLVTEAGSRVITDPYKPGAFGVITLDANDASELVETLKPRGAIPMRFKTPKCNLPLAGASS